MVESIYWQSGNTNMYTRDHYETGEGWFIVVSKEAMSAIMEMSIRRLRVDGVPIFLIRLIKRTA